MNTDIAPFKPKREYWTVMLHSVISFMGQSFMNIVDLLFCRDLGSTASATVGTATSLFAWFMVIGIGLISSLEFFLPHSVGEKNEEKAHSYFYAGIVVCTVISIVSTIGLIGLSSLTGPLGFNPEIAEPVRHFGYVTSLSYLAVFLVPVFRIELQTRGYSHDSTLGFLWGNVLNIFLNWVLVLGHLGVPALGVRGSSWASLLSRYGILLYMLIRVWQVRKNHPSPIHFLKVDYRKYGFAILKLGVPISLHMLFEMGAFIFVSTLAARISAAQNAAHSIVISLASFTFMIPLGISSAASQTISKALGEKNPKEAVMLGQMSLRMGIYYAVVASIHYVVFRNSLMSLYTTDPETLSIGAGLLFVVAFFQFGDSMQVILSGCLRGTGETAIQAKMNAVGHWFIGIPIGILLGFYFHFQTAGLWTGLCIGLWSVAFGLFFRWRKAALHLGV